MDDGLYAKEAENGERSGGYESPAEDVIVSGRINGEAAVLQKARIPLRAGDGGAGLERPLFSSGAADSSSGRASGVGGRRGGWLGEPHVSGGHHIMESPQSMLLSADQNTIMRMPNFGTFMHQQENLQALLVDIHEDPQGFTSFVEDRRDALKVLGEATVAALSTGEGNLSDYEGLQQVGRGRFSTVYYAQHKRTRKPYAIKRIQLATPEEPPRPRGGGTERDARAGLGGVQARGGAMGNSAGGGLDVPLAGGGNRGRNRGGRRGMTYEQCLKEVGLLKSLQSPNIVKLHTCFLQNNVLWVVMEWVDGGDLKGVLTRTRQANQRLNELAVWGYFTQICDALLHMHGQRIMHRDLKPANVLVCRDGTVKLGDLGLGRYLHARSALAMSQVGTPLYMSPETLQGQGHELVSDVWSLGCVLYELAMLKSPFAAQHLTVDKLFYKICRADYLPVDRTYYSERLSNLVDHLLVPDPRVRPKIDMVQPASHLALLAQRNGVEGLNVEQLVVCAGEMQGDYNAGAAVVQSHIASMYEDDVGALNAAAEQYPGQHHQRQHQHHFQDPRLQQGQAGAHDSVSPRVAGGYGVARGGTRAGEAGAPRVRDPYGQEQHVGVVGMASRRRGGNGAAGVGTPFGGVTAPRLSPGVDGGMKAGGIASGQGARTVARGASEEDEGGQYDDDDDEDEDDDEDDDDDDDEEEEEEEDDDDDEEEEEDYDDEADEADEAEMKYYCHRGEKKGKANAAAATAAAAAAQYAAAVSSSRQARLPPGSVAATSLPSSTSRGIVGPGSFNLPSSDSTFVRPGQSAHGTNRPLTSAAGKAQSKTVLPRADPAGSSPDVARGHRRVAKEGVHAHEGARRPLRSRGLGGNTNGNVCQDSRRPRSSREGKQQERQRPSSGCGECGSPHAGEKRSLGSSALTKSELGYELMDRLQQVEGNNGASHAGDRQTRLGARQSPNRWLQDGGDVAAPLWEGSGSNGGVTSGGQGSGGQGSGGLEPAFRGLSLENAAFESSPEFVKGKGAYGGLPGNEAGDRAGARRYMSGAGAVFAAR